MTARYTFDPRQSRFTVHASATGLFAFAAHSPTFAVRDFRGALRFEPSAMKDLALELAVRADSLDLVGHARESDRRDIEGRMWGEVLQVSAFPSISYQAEDVPLTPIAPGQSRLRIDGRLSLHGVTRVHPVDAELQVLEDVVRLLGGCPLRLSDYRISPVTALGGTIRLKDELNVSFDLIGLREAS